MANDCNQECPTCGQKCVIKKDKHKQDLVKYAGRLFLVTHWCSDRHHWPVKRT